MKVVDDLEFQPKTRKLKGKRIVSLCVGAGVLRETVQAKVGNRKLILSVGICCRTATIPNHTHTDLRNPTRRYEKGKVQFKPQSLRTHTGITY